MGFETEALEILGLKARIAELEEALHFAVGQLDDSGAREKQWTFDALIEASAPETSTAWTSSSAPAVGCVHIDEHGRKWVYTGICTPWETKTDEINPRLRPIGICPECLMAGGSHKLRCSKAETKEEQNG